MAAFKRKLVDFDTKDPPYTTSGLLPKNVSNWHLQHLTSIGITYSKNGLLSPLEVLDSVPFICKDISDDCESFMDYLSECIAFSITTNRHGIIFEDPKDEHLSRRREYRSDVARNMVETIDMNLNKLKSNYFSFEKAVSLVSRENTPLIYAAAFHFILRVRELVIKTFKGEKICEQFITDIMFKFGEIFCMISNSGGWTRRFFRVGDIMVTSLPDIRYSLMDLKHLPFQTVTVVSIVEVKKMRNIVCNYASRSETSFHSCKSSSDWSTTGSVLADIDTASESKAASSVSIPSTTMSSTAIQSEVNVAANMVSSTMSDFNIDTIEPEVLGKHGGELLAEYETVLTRPYVIGMIVHGTKIIVTCLKIDEEDYDEIKQNGKLPEGHSVEITYSRPFDLFFPEDRKILYKVFFRLSDKCCTNSSTKLNKNPLIDKAAQK